MSGRSVRKSMKVATIGLDLATRRAGCICWILEARWSRSSIPTTLSAMARKFGEFARTRLVLETGTHANRVHDALLSTGHEAFVANARNVRACDLGERAQERRS